MNAPQEMALSRFILLGLGKFFRLAAICISLGLTAVLSVSIYSSERTKSAEFDARHAEAVVRRQELDLALRRQEIERDRLELEKKSQRNVGGDAPKQKKKVGG
jgi:hypothetical protein